MDGRGEPLLDECNKLLVIPGENGCMILMVVRKELSTTENPWNFQ